MREQTIPEAVQSVLKKEFPVERYESQHGTVTLKEFPVERYESQHGTVTLREVTRKPHHRYGTMAREPIVKKQKQQGVDLGAGVVRQGKRQHIRLE